MPSDQGRPTTGSATYHIPVLCEEVLQLLVNDRDGLYVDCTVGGGGHAVRISEMLGNGGELLCLDADEEALAAASHRLRAFPRIQFVQRNFRELLPTLRSLNLRAPAGILLDLGVSSHQIDESDRGFSFQHNAPLDMRFDRRQPTSASDVVNTYDNTRLAALLYNYGEERASRAIARNIVAHRPISTTGELVAAVEAVVGSRFALKSLARVFQAVRIEVNGELAALERVLRDGIAALAPGGRIAVIAYHSLEDRIVKETFRSLAADHIPSGHKLVPDKEIIPAIVPVTRRPVLPTAEECARNPRARSAKLRVAEKRNGAVERTMGVK